MKTGSYHIDGEGRDELNRRYFKISVTGSDSQLAPFSIDSILAQPDKLYAELTNAGANLFSRQSKTDLLAALQSWPLTDPSFRVVTKVGWSGSHFILPRKTFRLSKRSVEVVLSQLDSAMVAKYATRGTLEQWQKQVAAPCYGNTRLVFALSLACSGPILRFVKGPRTGGFQICGPAETGKTTAGIVAGSVWGCHVGAERREKGFLESWHTTAGKVEITALAHNDTLLILDEASRAGRTATDRAEVISDLVFSLSEAVERERLTNEKAARAWRGYFLSTSNQSFSQLAVAGRVEIDDAHLGRFFDVPCPQSKHGIYDTVHDFGDGERLTDALKQRCRRHYGTAGRAFVARLVKDRKQNPKKLTKYLSKQRARYRKALRRMVKSGMRPLKRVSSRFATVYAAGRLAIRYKILPYRPQDLLQAILACQLDGLRQLSSNPTVGEPNESALRTKLTSYLRDNRSSFMDLGLSRPRKGIDDLDAVPGYVGCNKEKGWLYLTDKKLKVVIGTSSNAVALKQSLIQEALMENQKQGFVVQRRIFTGGTGTQNYAWVCAFKPMILSP